MQLQRHVDIKRTKRAIIIIQSRKFILNYFLSFLFIHLFIIVLVKHFFSKLINYEMFNAIIFKHYEERLFKRE
jgi:hypothetical protein